MILAQAQTSGGLSTMAIILIVLIGLLVILLAVILVVKRRKRKAAGPEAKPEWKSIDDLSDREDDEPAIERMKDSFEQAVKRLRRYVSGRDFQYGIPWYLLLGEQGSGKSRALAHVGLNLPLAGPPERRRSDVEWWFFEDGIVLDVPGEFLLARNPRDTRDRLWRSLLRLLQRHRRLRPIDGVVLTVPATDLFGPTRATAEKLERKADHIFQKLLEAQRILGFRFPIYILVTKCDVVPGFQAFVHEVPVSLRQGMLGWSSPFGVESAYTPRWVDDAFNELEDDLHRSQLELMQDRLQTSDPDGFFVFPRMLERLRQPLQTYLDEIFKESAYHEAFFLRGVYFSGDGGEETHEQPLFTFESGDGAPQNATSPDGAASNTGRPVFLTELFSRKVFPEFELAQPLSQVYFWRNRTARAYQIAAVVLFIIWGTGMAFAYNRLDDTAEMVEPALDEIRNDILALEDQKLEVHDRAFIEHAEDMVDVFATVHTTRFNSVFIPPLWFSDLDERIAMAFAIAFDRIIFKAIRIKLEERAEGAINASYYVPLPASRPFMPVLSSLYAEDLLAVDERHAFRELSRYVSTISDLEGQAQLYNQLPATRRPADFVSILEYLFGGRMPHNLQQQSFLLGSSMDQMRLEPFVPDSFHVPADARARVMLADLYTDLFRDNPLLLRVRDLAGKLDALTSLDRRAGTIGGSDVMLTRETLDAIARVEFALRSPSLSYLHMRADTTEDLEATPVTLAPAFDGLIATMDTSRFFSTELVASARRTASHGLAQTRQELMAVNAGMTGQILALNAEGELNLAPDLIAIRDALASLGSQQFVTGRYAIPSMIETGRYLRWNIGLLRQASDLPEQFRQFLQDRMGAVPPSLRAALEHGTSGKLAESVIGLVARAAIFQGDPGSTSLAGSRQHLQPQVENFAAAMPLISQILVALNEIGANDAEAVLRQLVSQQSTTLLGTTDAILEQERFYMLSANQIARWRDGVPIYATVFNTPDEKIIDVYLEMQWEGVSYLASTLAAPVVEAMSGGSAGQSTMMGGLVAKWSGVLRQVQNKANKVPGNSVDILEGSIRDAMMTATPEACLSETRDPIVRGELGDYFLMQASAFQKELGARCEQKALENAVQRYEQLAAFFNASIGGRFPFTEGIYAAGTMEPSAADIRRFYAYFDPFAAVSAPVLEQAFLRKELEGLAIRFVQQIKAARPLFASYLDEGDTSFALPVVDATVDFRVHNPREKLAEHIIDWSISTGGQQVRLGETDRLLRWSYGEPIQIELRLARNSPYAPVGAPGFTGRVDPVEKRVNLVYDNLWSLPHLLARHRVPVESFADGYDTKPHPLRLEVQLQRENEPIDTEILEAYFRLELVQPLTGARFALSDLPRRAPALRAPEGTN